MKATAVIALLGGVFAAFAADPFYLGTWKITSAAAAPWQTGRPYDDDTAEMKRLLNKIVIIKTNSITGPQPLGCRGPNYRVQDYPADMLFQGAFGEMHRNNPSADPAKLAAQSGFRGSSWKTLETGCANELDYHFINPTTAAFGLNNYIYILKKQ